MTTTDPNDRARLIALAVAVIAEALLDGDIGHAINDLAGQGELTPGQYADMVATRIIDELIDNNIRLDYDPDIEDPPATPVNELTLNRAKSTIATTLNGWTTRRGLAARLDIDIDARLDLAQRILTELADDDLLIIDNPGTDPQRALAAIIDGLPFGDRPAWALITLDNELGLNVTTAPDLHPSALAALVAGTDLILRQ